MSCWQGPQPPETPWPSSISSRHTGCTCPIRGGLTLFNPRRDVIRDSASFRNGDYGINIRGGGREGADEKNKSRLANNLAWGNGKADLKIKTGYKHAHVAAGHVRARVG